MCAAKSCTPVAGCTLNFKHWTWCALKLNERPKLIVHTEPGVYEFVVGYMDVLFCTQQVVYKCLLLRKCTKIIRQGVWCF